ncbi:hypothetical protein PGT21_036473 [Puccinia graminis f. sp. tritici]|uniref:Uncharacterized protein n=1 Tax=Puccinia graminis f. sp. tritici TaxID=56615 RepID=A0A5B0QRC3_PUCGR|nr:hypothetical protein PGT21_036473 [Puccinia graminis f. sp. tritici]
MDTFPSRTTTNTTTAMTATTHHTNNTTTTTTLPTSIATITTNQNTLINRNQVEEEEEEEEGQGQEQDEEDEEEQNYISDPLQQWLVFDPSSSPPIQEEEEEEEELDQDHLSSSTSSFQSINHPSIYHDTSMPSHDGRGHFFSPPDHSLSPDGSEFEYHSIPHNLPLPITTQSLSSLSDLDSQEDDLLSIPSSLSITRSGSSRSSNLRTHTHQEMSPEDAELLLTPMAMSAGFSHHSTIVGSTHEPGRVSSRSSHHSIDQQRARRSEPTSHSRRTHSRSSRRSRITHISSSHRSSSRTKPPIVIIPSSSSASSDNKNINHLSQRRIAAISFLTSVASKLLDLDSDTMNMLSTPPENQTIKNSTNHLSSSASTTPTKTRPPIRFSIGDDSRTSLTHEQDMISSPLDLSGFMPPSSKSVWRTTEEREEEEEQDGTQNDGKEGSGRMKSGQYGATSTLKIPHSRSVDRLRSSPSSTITPHLHRRSSSTLLLQDSRSRSLPPNNSEIPSTDSMASVLLNKVLNEWTNW